MNKGSETTIITLDAPAYMPAIGDTVRALDYHGRHQGGGVVLAVDYSYVTVAQRYSHRHNGVLIEQGSRPERYSFAGYTFEYVAA